MGVIQANEDAIQNGVAVVPEILLESAESTETEPDVDEGNDDHLLNALLSPSRRPRKPRLPRLPNLRHKDTITRHMGGRRRRRIQHATALMERIDEEDICDDLSDTLPENASAFTQLFLEEDKMAAWNRFVEKAEDDAWTKPRRPAPRRVPNPDKENMESAKTRFRRMETKYKVLLTRQHIPLGKIEQFEDELSDFFSSAPDGVWIGAFENGFERLLLHAVSQFLSLKSESHDVDGCRETIVENHVTPFIQPDQRLVDYLVENFKRLR